MRDDVQDLIFFVKDQLSYNNKKSKECLSRGEQHKSEKHSHKADKYKQILDVLNNRQTKPTVNQMFVPGKWRLGNLDDLPDELQQELSITEGDKLDLRIVDLVQSLDGAANVDEIIVGLYRLDGTIHSRRAIGTRLYRLTKKGMLVAVEGKRGLYALPFEHERILKAIEESAVDSDNEELPIAENNTHEDD